MIRVLLVDDHAVVRAGNRHLLQAAADIEVVAEAGSGEEACQCFSAAAPDVVVMDLSMPGMGGLEALRRMRARNANARILVFTMHDDTVFPARALEAGASGYLTKSSPPEKLVEAVRAIARGRKYLGDDIAQRLAIHRIHGDTALSALSSREFEVFVRLAEGDAPAEIAERLHLDYKSVINIQTRIREKLGVQNTAQLVRLAVRAGVIEAGGLE